MSRRRGNPDWGRVGPLPPAKPTEFEIIAGRLHLTPEMYVASHQLRTWCRCNRNRVYVPEWLLKEWGIIVDDRTTA